MARFSVLLDVTFEADVTVEVDDAGVALTGSLGRVNPQRSDPEAVKRIMAAALDAVPKLCPRCEEHLEPSSAHARDVMTGEVIGIMQLDTNREESK